MEESSPRESDYRILEILNLRKWDWEPDSRVDYPLTFHSRRKCDSFASNSSVTLVDNVHPGWRLQDVMLAAQLLANSKEKINYTDEAEMRRVFGLAYDVLRYRKILNCALDDVCFWQGYPQFRGREKLIWLLLYDMYGRKFVRTGIKSVMKQRNAALKEYGLLEMENALLDVKIRVAAGFSRLRIEGSALSLDKLLPDHLRTVEGVIWDQKDSIASGWVNSVKVHNRKQFVEEMKKLGMNLCLGCSPSHELDEDQYIFDPLCPKVVNIHEKARQKLAASQLVKTHSFVFLERSLCLGAATLMKAFKVEKFSGPVILSHSISPRHTGYLAELLVDLQGAGRLLVFGVGDNHAYHQLYLHELGISEQRCKLYVERYTSDLISPEIESATMVLATPPCSWTGIRDVVDLAVSRGGDLQFLEFLTSEKSETPQQPCPLLAEQMSTLKYALTKPSVQLVVYEVHTLLSCEAENIIQDAVQQVNRMALDRFQKRKTLSRQSFKKNFELSSSSKSTEFIEKFQDDSKSNMETEMTPDEIQISSKITDTDLFEVSDLNDVFNKDCKNLIDEGTFIAILKRKVITHSRFTTKVKDHKKVINLSEKELEFLQIYKQSIPTEISNTTQKRRKFNKLQFKQLNAPTQASTVRGKRDKHLCPRHRQHLENKESSVEKQVREARRRDAHRWWDEVAHVWRRTSDHPEDYRFQTLRTDPLTRKILFPSHVKQITYPKKDPVSFEVS